MRLVSGACWRDLIRMALCFIPDKRSVRSALPPLDLVKQCSEKNAQCGSAGFLKYIQGRLGCLLEFADPALCRRVVSSLLKQDDRAARARRTGFQFVSGTGPMGETVEFSKAPSQRSVPQTDDIAVIIPVYMGKLVLRELCERLTKTLAALTNRFSIILVDDRSPDNAWPLIVELGKQDPRIRGIRLKPESRVSITL